MATRNVSRKSASAQTEIPVSSPVEDLLLQALAREDDSMKTGRMLVTYRQGDAGAEDGSKAFAASLSTQGFRIADARDFKEQAVTLEAVGDADALFFPEIGVSVMAGGAIESHGFNIQAEVEGEGPVEAVEPEYFAFAENSQYLRGFLAAAGKIAEDLKMKLPEDEYADVTDDIGVEAIGATWGLIRCKVPPSTQTGAGIRVAVLDTGMDLGHPDFAGRSVASGSFVGQPVQDLNGHGTHCIGTSCGPKTPPGNIPRYGIAHAGRIFAGKVLTNTGSGTGASVLAGMNWAIANRCHVISMSLGSPSPVQAAYTAAGTAALARGLLIIAAAGNETRSTGAPANSPTIMSVASLDPDLRPSSFSNFGKIEISAPGRDVFSSWPRPQRHRTISGTSMATPHVSGCAALWAQSSPALRGINLWRRLQASAQRLPFPRTRVGAGLVQAP